jgi:hypothetical protein
LNFNEIGIQANKQGARVLIKHGSLQVYNTIPKFREWLIVNCIVNASGVFKKRFYIFRDEGIKDGYIINYKLGSCMMMQKKAWMMFFFQEIPIIPQKFS